MSYITEAPNTPGTTGEPFIDIPKMSDEEGLIVARGEHVYAVSEPVSLQPGAPDGGSVPQGRGTRRPDAGRRAPS